VARPELSSTMSTVDDVEFALQLSVGDRDLGMTLSGVRFPDTMLPNNPGWYLLPMGEATLPAAALSDLNVGTGKARNLLQATLFCRHRFTASGKEIQFAALLCLPSSTWWGEWYAWRETRQADYEVVQDQGILFDARGSSLLVGATEANTTDVPVRTPYAYAARTGKPLLYPKRGGFLYARPLRGLRNANGSHILHLGDALTATVTAMPTTRGLVAS
jgi:hypothetical protein